MKQSGAESHGSETSMLESVFKSMKENLHFLGKITVYALRHRTQNGHVKSSFTI